MIHFYVNKTMQARDGNFFLIITIIIITFIYK